MPDLPKKTSYPVLREEIVRILQEGKARALQAVEREKVQTYREVGRILHEQILANKERADYGEQVIARLAEDLEMDRRRLYEMLKFYRLFPIVQAPGQLGWTHYHLLLSLPSEVERNFYEREAAHENWSTRDLKAQIKAGAFAQAQRQIPETAISELESEAPLSVRRGQLYTYRLVQPLTIHSRQPGLWLDLGFDVRHALPLDGIERAAPDTVVEAVQDADAPKGYGLRISRAGRNALYTFRGIVEKVVDGDTLWVRIDCGFRVWVRQKLRLRGIDTPELPSPLARQARDFVGQVANSVPFVVLTTTKPDKYDRYLSDIFYLPGETDPRVVLNNGIFLNQQLMDRGLARRFKA